MRYEVRWPDVLGNAIDGWAINDEHRGREVVIEDGDDIFDVLKAHGLLVKGTRRSSVGVDDGHDGPILVTDERRPRLRGKPEDNNYGYGMPILTLHPLD